MVILSSVVDVMLQDGCVAAEWMVEKYSTWFICFFLNDI